MSSNNKIYIAIILFISVLAIICPASLAAREKTETSEIVSFDQEKLVIKANKTPLGEILDQIYLNCMVKILGMESREKEQITFSATGETTEDVLKRLLRHMNERNYAFEYNNVRLVKISVLPKSKTRASSNPVQENVINNPDTPDTLIGAVRVQKVVEGTQAETLELRKGDIIVSYDGIKISSAHQLVSEVKNKSDSDSVELVIMRDQEPMSFIVKGGLIGVNINTVRVPKEEIGERD